MIIEKLGKKDIEAMEIGKLYVFTLPDRKAVKTARSQISQAKDYDNMDFESVKTDEPLTLAYRRIK